MATGFGRTVWALDSIRTGRYVSGKAAVAQSLYRRFSTPRGTLQGGDEESVYGYDLSGLIGVLSDDELVAALPLMVRAEALKDDRVSDVATTVTSATASNGDVELTVEILATLADSAETFALTLAVSEATVELLGVTE